VTTPKDDVDLLTNAHAQRTTLPLPVAAPVPAPSGHLVGDPPAPNPSPRADVPHEKRTSTSMHRAADGGPNDAGHGRKALQKHEIRAIFDSLSQTLEDPAPSRTGIRAHRVFRAKSPRIEEQDPDHGAGNRSEAFGRGTCDGGAGRCRPDEAFRRGGRSPRRRASYSYH
jgi:hypothetical protein